MIFINHWWNSLQCHKAATINWSCHTMRYGWIQVCHLYKSCCMSPSHAIMRFGMCIAYKKKICFYWTACTSGRWTAIDLFLSWFCNNVEMNQWNCQTMTVIDRYSRNVNRIVCYSSLSDLKATTFHADVIIKSSWIWINCVFNVHVKWNAVTIKNMPFSMAHSWYFLCKSEPVYNVIIVFIMAVPLFCYTFFFLHVAVADFFFFFFSARLNPIYLCKHKNTSNTFTIDFQAIYVINLIVMWGWVWTNRTNNKYYIFIYNMTIIMQMIACLTFN